MRSLRAVGARSGVPGTWTPRALTVPRGTRRPGQRGRLTTGTTGENNGDAARVYRVGTTGAGSASHDINGRRRISTPSVSVSAHSALPGAGYVVAYCDALKARGYDAARYVIIGAGICYRRQ